MDILSSILLMLIVFFMFFVLLGTMKLISNSIRVELLALLLINNNVVENWQQARNKAKDFIKEEKS